MNPSRIERLYVVLYSGRSPIARAIRWQTRGRYSHAAVVGVDDAGRMALWEAKEFFGVRCRDVAAADWSDADWYEVVPAYDGCRAVGFLNAQVGKGYDYTMVARFVTRRQASRRTCNRWFCSELVYAAFLVGGRPIFERTEPWEVSPDLLSRSPWLLRRCK